MELFPVISELPNFDSFHPPNEKGSLGTGTPIFTPIIPARNRGANHSATAPLLWQRQRQYEWSFFARALKAYDA